MLTITVMSSEWQTIGSFAAPASKAGLQLSTKHWDMGFWGILRPFFAHSSPSTSHHLFFTLFYFAPARPLALLTPQRGVGGRITDKSPGVLDSAVLVRAQHILARGSGCHMLSERRRISAVTSFPSIIPEFLPCNKFETHPNTQQNKRIDFPFNVNFTNQWGEREREGKKRNSWDGKKKVR